jgi:hypothetical protein
MSASGKGPSRTVCDMVDGRDGFRCLRCGAPLNGWDGGSRHHRRPRSHPWPGLHEASNLVDLCGSGTTGCHGWVHAHPAEAYRYGWLVHAWREAAEVPVLTDRQGWVWLSDDGSARRLTVAETDSWLAETGLKWSVDRLDPMVGAKVTVTLGSGLTDTGLLTALTDEPDGVVAVTIDAETDWRLEDNATIDYFKTNQGEEK